MEKFSSSLEQYDKEKQQTRDPFRILSPQLSSITRKPTLSPLQLQKVQEIRDQLSKSAFYRGVLVELSLDFWRMEGMFTKLEQKLKHVSIDWRDLISIGTKTLFTTIVESGVYVKSKSYVIVVFVSGKTGDSVGSLQYSSNKTLDIVDDIIRPFLPQSAPHLEHIPKVFFISAFTDMRNTTPPAFPNDPDSNYCVAYHLSPEPCEPIEWVRYITEHLFTGVSVQEIIENSAQIIVDKNNEELHRLCCLKDNLLLGQ